MKSKRTISYIGLWALIMPWLGFTWETKTVLFSLTGIILLIIGNRQYHNEKKKQIFKNNDIPVENNHNNNYSNNTIADNKSINIQSNPDILDNNTISTSSPNNIEDVNTFNPKPRTRKRIEMAPRIKRITVKKEPTFINNDVNIDQNELSDFS